MRGVVVALALLAVPVVAVGEQTTPVVHGSCEVGRAHANVLLTCREDLTDCFGTVMARASCPQRMREAMREATLFINQRGGACDL